MAQLWTDLKTFFTKTQWGLPMWGLIAGVAAVAYLFLGNKKKRAWRR